MWLREQFHTFFISLLQLTSIKYQPCKNHGESQHDFGPNWDCSPSFPHVVCLAFTGLSSLSNARILPRFLHSVLQLLNPSWSDCRSTNTRWGSISIWHSQDSTMKWRISSNSRTNPLYHILLLLLQLLKTCFNGFLFRTTPSSPLPSAPETITTPESHRRRRFYLGISWVGMELLESTSGTRRTSACTAFLFAWVNLNLPPFSPLFRLRWVGCSSFQSSNSISCCLKIEAVGFRVYWNWMWGVLGFP